MPRLAFSRYADLIQYDLEQGALLLIDARRLPQATLMNVTDLAASAEPIAALGMLDAQAEAFAAAYGLALAARQWRERPTDARRGAIIQAAAWLRPASDMLLLAAALATADAALLAGHDAEQAIVELVNERVRLADRAANRCGRHAAGLIERGDRVLCAGSGGPPLFALLGELSPDVATSINMIVADLQGQGAPLLELVASAAGIGVRHAVEPETSVIAESTICVASALAVAVDGGAVCVAGTGAVLEAARRQNVPCYLLAPHGPTAEAATAHRLATGMGGVDLLSPELVSTFITDRGLYRPAMIGRYLNDGEAPLDVIPLLG